jgi:4-amino-4-deoxy-L-arabinose transferase-like glycosyltransferase
MNRNRFYLLLIVGLSLFLRLQNIKQTFPFIGDQGWFYVSAKDLLTTSEIPLIGITASHTWLHQGALWTYMLSPAIKLTNFDPIGGVYLSILLGVLTVIMIYIVSKEILKSEKAGIISALLLAISPLAVLDSRMAYHTSPLALFTLIFIFALYKYAVGKIKYLILAGFFLGLLYHLELATMVFWVLIIIVILLTKKVNLRIFILSFAAFLIALSPMIIHDLKMQEGFYQTTAFIRLIKISIFDSSGFNQNVYLNVLQGLLSYIKNLLFVGSIIGSSLLLFTGILYLCGYIYRTKKIDKEKGILILSLWLLLSFAGIFMNKTASGAYLPIFYPGIIIFVAFMFSNLIKKYPNFRIIIYLIIFIICSVNIKSLLSTNYFTNQGFITYQERLSASKKIVEISGNKKYNLMLVGQGSEFPNNLKNYEYLTWYLGNAPSKQKERLIIAIKEEKGKVFISRE